MADTIPDDEQTPGYRRRKQELADAEDVYQGGSTAGKAALKQARDAVTRQENIIKLRRKKKPGQPEYEVKE